MKATSKKAQKPKVPTALENAAKLIKRHAAKQPVRIRLSKEQMEAIEKQWGKFDPKKPAEITFYVGRKAQAQFKIASYSYRGDTCCV